jgi:serine/threonine protein kinase
MRESLMFNLLQLNVLIDDTGNAVLCDFGLSRVRNDITTRTARAGFTGVTGSRNWMAPERLIGGSLRKPADIYSFAMLMFEVRIVLLLSYTISLTMR